MEKKRHFADDLDQGHGKEKDKVEEDVNQYASLQDKWNDIQDGYLEKYPELETEELLLAGGGFEGLLESIGKILNKPVKEVREEIKNW